MLGPWLKAACCAVQCFGGGSQPRLTAAVLRREVLWRRTYGEGAKVS
ncbi:hypothetical protein NPIL_270241, partial [Nephila pilipes]